MSSCSVRRVNGFRPVRRGLYISGSFCAIRSLSAVVVLLSFVTAGTAQLGATEIQVLPPHPTTEDPIVLVLSGTWKDSCVPQAPKAMILGSQIEVTTSNPGEVCLTVLTPWQLTVPIGTLSSPGWYSVVVVHNGQPIGGIEFEVRSSSSPRPPTTTMPGISGTTDGDGRFSLPLPWPGTMVSGRLLHQDGRPLAFQRLDLGLVSRTEWTLFPQNVVGFTFSVPGYAATTVTQFATVSLLGLTSFLLGDVQLVAVELPWSANRPLTWDDFQGDPPEGAKDGDEAAQIVMWLGYSFKARTWREGGKWKAHLTQVTTTNTMDRSKSWVVPGEKTPALLSHEQKHFDLNEVYRRLLDAALQKLVCSLEATGETEEEANDNLHKKLKETFDAVNRKCDEVQEQYDKETDHGRNAAKQKEWDKKIADWLADPTKAPQP